MAQLTAWAKGAAGGGYLELLRNLLDCGAEPTAVPSGCASPLSPLMAAPQSGMADALQMCLEAAPGGVTAAINQ